MRFVVLLLCFLCAACTADGREDLDYFNCYPKPSPSAEDGFVIVCEIITSA